MTKQLTTADFDFESATRTLSEECSTLHAKGFEINNRISILSVLTGKTILFEVRKFNRDQEGDVVSWVYKPVAGQDVSKDITVVIYND